MPRKLAEHRALNLRDLLLATACTATLVALFRPAYWIYSNPHEFASMLDRRTATWILMSSTIDDCMPSNHPPGRFLSTERFGVAN